VLDATSFPKQGQQSVRLQPQYSGSLGKRANCQVMVSAEYVADEPASSTPLHWPVTAQLYLPERWADDSERRQRAHIPEEIAFQTKPQLALALLDRARAWQVPYRFVVADAGYGDNPTFLDGLEEREIQYVCGVDRDFGVRLPAEVREAAAAQPEKRPGKGRPRLPRPAPLHTVEAVTATLDDSAWQTISWREGTKGAMGKQFTAVRVHRATGGAGWGKEARLKLRSELAKGYDLDQISWIDLLIWLCPTTRDAAGFLSWLNSLSVGQIYERLAPFVREGCPPLPHDLAAMRDIYARLLELSLRFYQGAKTGDLIYRATWDAYSFQTLFQQGLITFLTALVSLALMMVVMWRLNIPLTLAAAATIPVLLISIKVFGRKMRERGVCAQQADSQKPPANPPLTAEQKAEFDRLDKETQIAFDGGNIHTAEQLWQKLLAGDESVMIEAKTASEVGSGILETISSFSNEPNRGGGYLLLGVALAERAPLVRCMDDVQWAHATSRDLLRYALRRWVESGVRALVVCRL